MLILHNLLLRDTEHGKWSSSGASRVILGELAYLFIDNLFRGIVFNKDISEAPTDSYMTLAIGTHTEVRPVDFSMHNIDVAPSIGFNTVCTNKAARSANTGEMRHIRNIVFHTPYTFCITVWHLPCSGQNCLLPLIETTISRITTLNTTEDI